MLLEGGLVGGVWGKKSLGKSIFQLPAGGEEGIGKLVAEEANFARGVKLKFSAGRLGCLLRFGKRYWGPRRMQG